MSSISMSEIARRANVSLSTVSRVLNHQKKHIKAETRQRVLDVLRECQYRPNYFGKSLKQGRTRCIGLVGSLTMARFNAPYFAHTVAGVDDEMVALNSEYSLTIFGAHANGSYEKSLALIEKGLVDGLIMIVLAQDLPLFEEKFLPVLDHGNIPFVIIHSLARAMPYPNVGFNRFESGRLGAARLLAQGCDEVRICLMAEALPHTQEVLAGVEAALRETGKPFGQDQIHVYGHLSDAQIYEDVRDFVSRADAMTGVLALGDMATCGAHRGNQERSGAPVHLVGLCDTPPSPPFDFQLDLVLQPVQEKGHRAVRMLLELLDGTRNPDGPHQEIVEPECRFRHG